MEPTNHQFLHSYLACAIWSSAVEVDGETVECDSLGHDFAPEAMQEAATVCAAFITANAADLGGLDPSQCGHDLWLTRNHHGAGFWDRGYAKAIGDRLTAAAHALGAAHVWVDEAERFQIEEG